MGTVRAILRNVLHAETGVGRSHDNPAALLDVAPFQDDLLQLSEQDQARIADRYARLWTESVPRLHGHLQGRPFRVLHLVANEIYPYLRGDQLAVRIESRGLRQATLRFKADLSPDFLAGLVTSFLIRCGCEVRSLETKEVDGDLLVRVRPRVRSQYRLLALASHAQALRIPYLQHAAAAAIVGALLVAPGVSLSSFLLVVFGAIAVQVGSNGIHGLRAMYRPRPPAELPSPHLMWAATILGYGFAGYVGALFVPQVPLLALWLVMGLGLSLFYPMLAVRGIGPITAAINYGPLMVTGAALALSGSFEWEGLLVGLPLGLAAGSHLYVQDMGERPINQALAGRNLLLQVPTRLHLATLLLVQLLVLGMMYTLVGPSAIILVVWSILLVATTWQHLDDPALLAPARMYALLGHATVVMLLTLPPLL